MTHESDRDYHLRRARAELDLAYRARREAAAAAHLRLSSFHMAALTGTATDSGQARAG